MGWADFVGKAMTRDEFAAYVAGLKWSPSVWCPESPQLPRGIVLHNTGAPTLAQWAEAGPRHDARIQNLKSYYRDTMHWNGGPHLFVSRDWINVFDGLLEHGTHSPSFNRTHFGVEMVGDYDAEPFATGDGAKVRDSAVSAMATLCRAFGWSSSVIILHKEDPATTHKDCPGRNVDRADVRARVQALLGGEGLPPVAPAPPLTKRNVGIVATVFGGPGEPQRNAYTGELIGPGVVGVALPARFVGARPRVRMTMGLRTVTADVVDVGPWNTADPYWESGARPQAESGTDQRGRKTNGAGIDLTPAAAAAIGLDGKGKLDWEFA